MFFDVLFIKTKVEMSFLRHLYPAEPSILCFSLWLEFSWPFKLHGFRFNFKFSLNARSFLVEFAKCFLLNVPHQNAQFHSQSHCSLHYFSWHILLKTFYIQSPPPFGRTWGVRDFVLFIYYLPVSYHREGIILMFNKYFWIYKLNSV